MSCARTPRRWWWRRPGVSAGCSAQEREMTPHPLRVCHVMTADLWAGAEVQVATVASHLVSRPEVRVSAVLFNEGRLAVELRRLGVDVTVVDEQRTSSL